MTRPFTQAALFFTLGFAAMMLLMRLLPYRDGGLRELLMPPEDCTAPCWLNIQPGMTTLSGSSLILQQSPSISSFRAISPATALVGFSQTVPALKHGKVNLWEGKNGSLSRLTLFDTGLSFSDIQLILGKPQRIFVNSTIQYGLTHIAAVYIPYDMVVMGDFRGCSLNLKTLWQQTHNLQITIGGWQTAIKFPSDAYVSSVELDTSQWVTQLRHMKFCNS